MLKKINELYRYRELLKNLTFRELAERYKRSYLGFLWALLEPLGFMAIYAVVFSAIVRIDIPDYPIFLLCGLIPWIYFSKSLVYSAESIMKDARLVKKVYFPREALPISCVLARLINFIVSLSLLLAFLIIFKGFDLSLFGWLILVVFIQTILTAGLALIIAPLSVYLQDVRLLLDFLVLIWFYLSPVFYSVSMVPDNLRKIYILNPMVGILSSYTDILYYRRSPFSTEFYLSVIISAAIILTGMSLFNKFNRRIGELV